MRFHSTSYKLGISARRSFSLRWLQFMVVVMLVAALAGRPASAAISHRAAVGGNNGGGATTLVINKPSSPSAIVAGDVMIAIITVRGGTGTTITPPSGWNLINSNDSTTAIKSSTYYKIATASEGASYSWNLGVSALKASGVISAYSGVDTASPIMVQANQVNTSSTTMTAPSVTSTADGAMVIAAYSSPRGVTFTQASSMTLRGQSSSTGNPAASQTTSGLQDAVQATLGASGAKNMTQSTAGVNIGHTIALNPMPTFEQSGYRWFQDSTSTTGVPVTFAKAWGGAGNDAANALAIDASGNSYVVGYADSSGLSSETTYGDQTLVKYNSSGVEQWSKTWGGSGTDIATGVKLDTAGNIYVVGATDSAGLTAGSNDQTLVKYNSSGVEQWSKTWGGSGWDVAFGIALDNLDNIYVIGTTDTTGRTAGLDDQTLVKYNSSGVEQWSKTWGGTGADVTTAIAIDINNNIFVAGNSRSSGLSSETTNGDATLVKYNSSGVEQWSKTWGGTGIDSALAIALDTSGNIYTAGNTNTTGRTAGAEDQTLVKYNTSGVEQWSKTWGGTGVDVAYAIALDVSGNIYTAGFTESTDRTAGLKDQTLVKYNTSGVEQWSKTWGGDNNDGIYALAVDAAGGIYAAGYTKSTGLTAGDNDQALLRFDSSGNIAYCTYCVDRAVAEVDRAVTEVDRVTSEVDRAVTEVDRVTSEVDRTGVATINIICELATPTIDVGSPLGGVAQNTAATAPAEQQIFRLRTTLHVGVSSARPGHMFKLQYATMSGSCDTTFSGESYSDVTTSTPIAYANNSTAADGQGLIANANDPTHNSDIKVIQEYNESNNTSVVSSILPGRDGLWDFALKDNGAAANTSYCFRIVKSDNSLLDAYSVVPQITTQATTFEQSGYRWFENQDASSGGETFVKRWGGDGSDTAYALAVDTSGNIYVVGETSSTGLTAGGADQTLVKYDSSGVEQWSKTWGGEGIDIASSIAIGSTGDVYVAGWTESSGLTSGTYDQTIVKYNSSGVEQWSKTWGGVGIDQANGIALDSSDNVYVVGSTGTAGLITGNMDQTLVKYNSSGVEQWSKTWGGAGGYSIAAAVEVDGSGNIFVVGRTNSPGISSGTFDQTLVKYNSSGVEQWSKTWGGSGVADYAYDVAKNSLGDIFVVGTTDSSGLTTGYVDQTLVKYNSSGVEQWSKIWGGSSSSENAYAVELDSSDNIYVAGDARSTGLTAGNNDQTLVKYNSSGVEQWSKTWGGTQFEIARDLALDSSGKIYMVGEATNSLTSFGNYDQSVLKFDSSGDITNCNSCVDRTMSEVDRTMSEVDRTVSEVDRTMSEVDRTMSEVDRTNIATLTVVCGVAPIDVSTPLAALNTTATAPSSPTIFRLRSLIHVANKTAANGSATFKLQYAAMSGTCDISFTGETYADVTTSTAIAYGDNPNGTEGTVLTANANDPTHSGHTVVLQEYNELNNTSIATSIPADQDGLWDFALKDNDAPSNTSYCFRIVKSTGALLDTYSYIPQITTVAGQSGPTLNQQMRGGQSVLDGIKQLMGW